MSADLSDDASRHDIRKTLARAFDRAWDEYHREDQLTMNEDLVRAELAKQIVELSKAGVIDELELASSGLAHLRRLFSDNRPAVDTVWLNRKAPDNLA